VGLDDDRGVGVLGERGLQHRVEGGSVGEPAADRQIAGGLIDDEHARSARGTEVDRAGRRVVVLAEPGLAHAIDRAARTLEERRIGEGSGSSAPERMRSRRDSLRAS